MNNHRRAERSRVPDFSTQKRKCEKAAKTVQTTINDPRRLSLIQMHTSAGCLPTKRWARPGSRLRRSLKSFNDRRFPKNGLVLQKQLPNRFRRSFVNRIHGYGAEAIRLIEL